MAQKSERAESHSIGLLLKQVSEELEKECNNTMKAVDLTAAQARFLLLIEQAPGSMVTLKELEQLSHTAQATCAGTVARLEKKGLVESSPDESDRRVKNVTLTRQGRERLYAAGSYLRQAERHVLGNLSEPERDELQCLLQKIREGMR